MVAVSLALFIFDEIMRPSVTTYVSEGPRITLRYIRNEFLVNDFCTVVLCAAVDKISTNIMSTAFQLTYRVARSLCNS